MNASLEELRILCVIMLMSIFTQKLGLSNRFECSQMSSLGAFLAQGSQGD